MKINFCNDWKFINLNTNKTAIVNLPHDAMLTEKRDEFGVEGKTTGYFGGGKYLYTKSLTVNPLWKKQAVFLIFPGIYGLTQIKVNDQLVCEHHYGYSEIKVDLTSFLKMEQLKIEVFVDNSQQPNSRWYSGSGLYRPAYLLVEPSAGIENLEISTLRYQPAIISVTTKQQDTQVKIYFQDQLVYSGFEGEITIPDAHLWSAETPNLYRCVVENQNDTKQRLFGIVKIDNLPGKGLFVNGQAVKLRGGCIHHDNGILRACAFQDAEFRKVKILKENGFNAIRSAHNPCSDELLTACDQLGMYVLDEFCDGWYTPKNRYDYSNYIRADFKRDLTWMIQRDKEHPSVIMYSIGNEVTESASQPGVEFAQKLIKTIKQIDRQRPVTCGVNPMLNVLAVKGIGLYQADKVDKQPVQNKKKSSKKTGSAFFNALMEKANWFTDKVSTTKTADRAISDIMGVLDVAGFNYGSRRYDSDVKRHASWNILGTETLVVDLPYNWERVEKYPNVIGDFVWSAFDYLGETGTGDWRYFSDPGLPLISGSGTIDILGNPGAENFFQRTVWGQQNKPFIGVRSLKVNQEIPQKSRWRFTNAISSWSWSGFENQKATIDVFCRASSVAIWINQKKIGQKRIKNFKATFQTKYIPGKITAIAYDRHGNELTSSCLMTAWGKTQLSAKPDKKVLRANGQDLCYLPIELVGLDGITKVTEDQQIKVTVTGAGKLQALGNANCTTNESYLDDVHSTYFGKALAIIRAGNDQGIVTVEISGKGLESLKVQLEVIGD